MAYVTRERGGLVLAEQAMDEAAISRALKRINERYVLQRHPREGVEGGWVYKVFYVWSDDHPPHPVLTWMDDYGNALPLSSGLIELVERHQVGARNVGPDADEYEREYQERTAREAEDRRNELIAEHQPRLAGRLQVSLAHTSRKPQWLKERGGRISRGG